MAMSSTVTERPTVVEPSLRAPTQGPTHGPARAAPRMALLDALRLFAALVVVLFHYTAWHHTHWDPAGTQTAAQSWPLLSQFTAYGNLGVQLFFVLSGLVVLRSVEGRGGSAFIASRVSRLVPALWFVVLFTGGLQLIAWSDPNPGLRWSDLPLSAVLGSELAQRPWVDGVMWTLWVEVRFYAMLLVLLLLARGRTSMFVGFAVAWPLIAAAVAASRGFEHADASFINLWIMPKYAGLFAAGMLLHVIAKHGGTFVRWCGLAAATAQAVWATAASVPEDTFRATGVAVSPTVYAAAVLVIVLVVAAIVLTPLRKIDWRWLTVAGALTYPLYLIHEIPGWGLIGLLAPVLPRSVVLAVVLVCVAVAAWLIHRWIERPLGSRLNRWMRGALESLRRSTSRLLAGG